MEIGAPGLAFTAGICGLNQWISQSPCPLEKVVQLLRASILFVH